jgi:dolichol-phosphate mannosyltransferase
MTTIDVIVPVCDEGPEFGATLVRLADYLALHSSWYRFDFLIVDDASTDTTREMALGFARHRRNITVLSHDRRYGLGRALRTGFNKASADYAIVIDVRSRNAPYVAMQLVEAIETVGADVAVASPALPRKSGMLTRVKARFEVFTCMVRAYRTAFLKHVPFKCEGAAANAEVLLGAIGRGASVVEVLSPALAGPIRHEGRLSQFLYLLARRFWACPTHFRTLHSRV